MATLADRLGLRNSTLSRVIPGTRNLSKVYVDGIVILVMESGVLRESASGASTEPAP